MQQKEKQTKPFKDTPPPPLTTFKESYIIITSSYIRARTLPGVVFGSVAQLPLFLIHSALPAAHVANIRAEQYLNAGLFPKKHFPDVFSHEFKT